jgi:hypothetical protein
MAYAELLPTLLAWALFLTGYEDPGMYPPVNFASTTVLNEMICPRAPAGCGILGVFADGEIYLNEEFDLKENAYARSILVHEIVHWLQHLNNEYGSGTYEACVAANRREVEAYGVQNAYLRQAERSSIKVGNNPPACARYYTPRLNIK